MSLASLVGSFVLRHWKAYASSAAMLIGVAVCSVWVPRKVGAMIDGLAAHRLSQHDLMVGIAQLLALGVAIYVLRVCWRVRLYSAAYRLGVELRMRLYARLSSQGPAFYQKQRTGDLMALGTNDIDAIEMAAGEAMLAGFDGTLTLVMVLGVMLLGVDYRLALIALLPFPLMGLAFWTISRHIHTAETDSLKRFSDLNDHVQESLSGVRTLRALGLEARSAGQFGELAGKASDASLAAQKWEAAYEPAVGLTLTAASTLTLGLGGYLVWQNQLTIGALTSFTMYLGQLIWPMFAAGWVLSLIERGRAGLARLQPMLDAPLTVVDEGRIEQIEDGPLVLREVSFTYAGSVQPALDKVSVALRPGMTMGLVGATGAGKSTLLRVLLRQAEPQQGEVTWGGHRLEDYKLAALRAATSWVPQESFLFSASIAENIALGYPGASRTEIEHAAKMADIHDDILRFPDGYDTPVGEKGITLSGGQRQRVAIARAIYKDAPVLILDEATSALDNESERAVQAALDTLMAGRTTLVIAHRLSTIERADRIVVMEAGRIVEQGTHEELLGANGMYANLYRLQFAAASNA